jgi:ABC-type multidrug transport system fused ATPase/permease subunit
LRDKFVYLSKLKAMFGEYIKPYLAINLTFGLVEQALVLSLPLIIGQIVLSLPQDDRVTIVICAAALVCVLGLYPLLSNLRWKLETRRVTILLEREIHRVSIQRISNLMPSHVDGNAGKIYDTVEQGKRAILDVTTAVSLKFIPTFFVITLSIGALFVLKLYFACLLCLVCFIAYWRGSWKVNRRFLARIEDATQSEAALEGSFREKMSNMILIIMNNQSEAEMTRFSREHKEATEREHSTWREYLDVMMKLRGGVSVLCYGALLVWSVIRLLNREMATQDFVYTLWWSYTAIAAISSLMTPERELMENWGRIKRHLNLFEMVPTRVSVDTLIKPPSFTGIKLRKVSYAYPDMFAEEPKKLEYALVDVTLDIEPGEFVAMVGRTGSGKTTAFNVLLGFCAPVKGKGFVSRVNMKDIDRKWYWGRIGYVPQGQKLMLWSTTIRENILYGRRDVPEERLIEAMKAAKIYEKFYLGGRMNQKLSEGSGISGGERQRIAIARALVGDPDILMFDEAMTGLDPETEHQLNRTIFDLTKVRDESGRRKYTIIVVTHNMKLAELADKVAVFEDHRLESFGTHAEVLAKSAVYPKLVNIDYDAPGSANPFGSEEVKVNGHQAGQLISA